MCAADSDRNLGERRPGQSGKEVSVDDTKGTALEDSLRSPSGVLFLAFVFIFLCPCSAQTQAQLDPNEVAVLREVATTLGKVDWNFSADPCSGQWGWVSPSVGKTYDNSLTCSCTQDPKACHVISIVLKGQGLNGTLPKELTELPYLGQFDVTRNYLSGTIPKEWDTLQVVNISLMANRLSGPIPKEFWNISTLKNISLEANQFSGEIPLDIGNLINLERLVISSNNFTGELPVTLGRLTNMIDFRIADNKFSGKLPDFMGNWTKLEKLTIHGTDLQGPIPSGIGNLEKLTQLSISDINGRDLRFPNLQNTSALKRLILRNCKLSDQIPPYIGQFTNLKILDLSFNNLTGALPESLQSLKLNYLSLSNNSLTGNISDSILKKSVAVDLSYNNFIMDPVIQTKCMQETANLVESFSMAMMGSRNLIHRCLKKDHPCDARKPKYNSFHINCGSSKRVNIGSTTFDADESTSKSAKFFVSSEGDWAFSNTGVFLDADESNNDIVSNSSLLSMADPELYTTARVSPISLKYYGLCLWDGNYTVKLHFAEIQMTDDKNFSSLGSRIFDVYIQGKLVLKDFNIKSAANGSGKATVKTFTVEVKYNTLEIHFFWSGKGSTAIPRRGVYGPLISAISVNADFQIPKDYKRRNIIIGSVVGTTSLLLLMFLSLCILWKKGFLGHEPEKAELQGLDLLTGSFTLRQIKAATKNFDPANKIGEGGFGSVYKGHLSDGTIVAIKQLSSKSKQGSKEFITEIGMISALQHPHLVRLYGCCTEGRQLLLVYEYMENNSLASALFGPKENRLKLNWPSRRKICIGIAKGLAYLHEESVLKIVHRDIKSTNVLLDKNLNSKISDFGLAKLDEEDNTHISTRIAGTFGYMAPEYAMRGHLTYKADVYSFGIVALEIISGKSNSSYQHQEEGYYLLDWAYVLEDRGDLLELIDPDLGSEYSKKEALTMLNVAILCTNSSPSLRPTMSTVVSMLEGQIDVSSSDVSNVNFSSRTHRLHSRRSSNPSHSHRYSIDVPWSGSSISFPRETDASVLLTESSREFFHLT